MIFAFSDVPEEMPENALSLWMQFQEAWRKLANSVSEPDMLFDLFYDITDNPLCFAVTGALLVVFGFKIFAHIISVVQSRH